MRFLGMESLARMSEYSKKPTTGGESRYEALPVRGCTRSITTPFSHMASRRGASSAAGTSRRRASFSSEVGRQGSRAASAASSGV